MTTAVRPERHLAAWLVLGLSLVTSVAAATDLRSASSQRFDIQDGLGGAFSSDGSLSDGTSDSYDGCYYLTVGGTRFTTSTATTSLDGRQIDLSAQPVGAGLTAARHIWVPATGPSFARYLEVIENPTPGDVMTTVTIDGNLGSDGSTVLVATSSGDLTIGTDDSWFASDDTDGSGDPSLAHVFQGAGGVVTASGLSTTGSAGSDALQYSFEVTVPASGRVAILHFAVQETNRATATASASQIAELPDEVLTGLDEYLGDVVNWPVASSGACAGTAEGGACTSTRGEAGRCHASRCCTGCWDGAVCRSGRTTSACAIGGAACVTCASVAFCSSASCTAGVCSGSPCDDGESCTTDTCDESLDRCNHTVSGGCIVGGECVGDGEHHVAYPCLVCDPRRNPDDWSPVAIGASCGATRCNLGRLFQGGTCDGAGDCVAPRVEICETEMCADPTSCAPRCTTTSCAGSERCAESGRCEPLRGRGESCVADVDCLVGACVDGVCCAGSCAGTCESCALPGTEGACTPIAGGTDPYAECAGARVCDGAGACAMPGEDAGRRPDAGLDGTIVDGGPATTDATTGVDAGTTEPPRGCACGVGGAAAPGGGAWLWLLGVAAVAMRRLRRA